MREIRCLFQIILETISDLKQAAGYFYTFLSALFISRATLAARVLAAESHLAACKRRIEGKDRPRPRFTQAFRLRWVLLSKAWDEWHQVAHHSLPSLLAQEVEGAAWPASRAKGDAGSDSPAEPRESFMECRTSRDTLRLLGCDPTCDDTIRKYMGQPKNQPDKPTNWLPFLRNHLDVSWAMDFFTVVTADFSCLYVFVVFEHGRRKVIHFATTYHPSMAWVLQQLREAAPLGRQPRYVFRDNDGIYGQGIRAFLDDCGIEEVRTAYRSPWQNPYVERFFGTVRRELLDHVIVLSERHLNRLLTGNTLSSITILGDPIRD